MVRDFSLLGLVCLTLFFVFPVEPCVAQDELPVLELEFERPLEPAGSTSTIGNLAIESGAGPSQPLYPAMPVENAAMRLKKAGARIVWRDPGEHSKFDFSTGDQITIEAWVKLPAIGTGQHSYLLSKGRTYEGERLENHNYALRLTGGGGQALPSFLFSTLSGDGRPQYHRWTAKTGFGPGNDWHHVAVTYHFGKPESLAAVVDGRQVSGKWDMAGPTAQPPIESDESVWLGSSRGGDAGNSFVGWLDNVRMHRRAIEVTALMDRYRVDRQPPTFLAAEQGDLSSSKGVFVTIHENAGSYQNFSLTPPPESARVSLPAMVLHRLPLKYEAGGFRKLWKGPVLVRMHARAIFTDEECELLLRAPGLSQLWVDGQVVLKTPARRLFPNAHQPMVVYKPDLPWLRVPRVGDRESRVRLKLEAGEHEFVLETLVGSQTSRCEPGETLVAYREIDGHAQKPHDRAMFNVLMGGADASPIPLTDAGVEPLLLKLETILADQDAVSLAMQSQQHNREWARYAKQIAARHGIGSEVAAISLKRHKSLSGLLPSDSPVAEAEPLHWLRRVSLDTRGIPPTLGEIAQFRALPADERNEFFVDKFLADERWADHWTSYWQDVLAENPSILKPSLNNTGPFRYWIHDSLRENKPVHRLVGELVRMKGDVQAGGAAGFGMAAQNDVPMAEKAHVLASAYLAVDLKCARCHDAPYHPWKQSQLFEMAAMLKEKSIDVPVTSSVPGVFFDRHDGDAPIQITLRPGDIVRPNFPLGILVGVHSQQPVTSRTRGESTGDDRNSRERLIREILLSERFPKVVTNRVWERLMGWGLVTSVDDWYDAEVRAPLLLEELTNYLVKTGFDLKVLQRRILLSDVYARSAIDESIVADRFVAPWQRRLSAEQVVDSLHSVAGVEMATEVISFDPEASQKVANFLNLGVANRAWQLISLSNERDRPSLSLPKAAAVVECLEAFGWRAARQSPLTHRPQEANLVQPGVVANGHLTTAATRLTAGSQFEQLAIEIGSLDGLVNQMFLATLTREPTASERRAFTGVLADGFEDRIVERPSMTEQPPVHKGFVTWSNHFDVKANLLKREQEQALAVGPQPSPRLRGPWRRAAEDALWALFNSPEFQLVP